MRIPMTNPSALTSVSHTVKWNQGVGVDEQKTTTVSGTSSVTYTPYIPNDDVGSDYLTGMSHRSSVSNLADESLTTLTKQLGRLERAVQRERPDIADKAWDFGLKDGKVVAIGDDLSADDKAWLEERINDNSKLANAASAYISLATNYLETTKTNPAYIGVNFLTGNELKYNFHDTKKTLESSIGFRAFTRDLHTAYDTGHGEVTTGPFSAYISFDFLAARVLAPSNGAEK